MNDLIHRLVEDYAREHRIDLTLNENDRTTFLSPIEETDLQIKIHLQYNPESRTLLLYSGVGKIMNPDNRADIYGMLLNANYGFQDTEGTTFGIDASGFFIILSYQQSIDFLDKHRFTTIINNFIRIAKDWFMRLADVEDNLADFKREEKKDKGEEPPPDDIDNSLWV